MTLNPKLLKTGPKVPLFMTVPHSGEEIPPEAPWLKGLSRDVLLLDVDRFVTQLYEPTVIELEIPWVSTRTHRYAVDLNRYPDDVDQDSVEGAPEPSGTFSTGFHWVKTTRGHVLMQKSISPAQHELFVKKYHDPFHVEIADVVGVLRKRFIGMPIYHLDCHSMPSKGTDAHRDVGRVRAEVVISDVYGKSASPEFKDRVMNAFRGEGFEVAYNWPYSGGRITQRYGQPMNGHHSIQVELNRKLYLDETSREKLPGFPLFQMRLKAVMGLVVEGIAALHAP